MGKVKVITDSCASLPDSFWGEYDIGMVPYYVHVGSKSYRDLVDITRDGFLEHVRKADPLPKSANPGPADYVGLLLEAAETTDEVLVVCMTSIGSGAYQAAMLAKQMVAEDAPHLRVEVVDSRNVSMAQGWVALEAARAAEQGGDLDHLVALAGRMIPEARMLQTADTLRYLYLGGRIGRAKHLVGSLLKIKPIISMDDGVIVALGQERSRAATYTRMIDLMSGHVGRASAIKAAVVHAGDQEAADLLGAMVRESFECVEYLVTELSSALAVHTGPGTVGVCYFPVRTLTG
jgi:DegV family protein with EDD domain